MPRYSKQRNRSSCAPVAIYNAMKWAGMPDSYEQMVPLLIKACQTRPYPVGTSRRRFVKVLRHVFQNAPIKVRVQEVKEPKARDIASHLWRGGAVVLSYGHEEGGHTGLLVPGESEGLPIGTVNLYSDTPTLYYRTTRAFYRRHLSKKKDTYRRAWFLTKI